jgi:hypothetical protein
MGLVAMFDTNVSCMEKPLLDTAWSTLDAAHDLRDWWAVDACRRVIDASLCGKTPAETDLKTVFGFFGG